MMWGRGRWAFLSGPVGDFRILATKGTRNAKMQEPLEKLKVRRLPKSWRPPGEIHFPADDRG
jgi:hypothetical protein